MKLNQRNSALFLILLCSMVSFAQVQTDWLLQSDTYKAEITESEHTISLTNGLVLRKIQLLPNAATVEFKNLITQETMLRSIKPEAEVTLNDSIYHVGGLYGLKEHGYFKESWLNDLESQNSDFQYTSHVIEDIEPRIAWNSELRYNTAKSSFATGKRLTLKFNHESKELEGIEVLVHYEVFDGMPLISKWISVENHGKNTITLNRFKSELLAFPEVENPVETPNTWRKPNLHVESNYAFGGFTAGESTVTTFWEQDPEYTSQVNWKMETPCLLVSQLPVGPNLDLKPESTFESFRTYELLLEERGNREQTALSLRKMYRKLAPWVTENPIFMHLTTTDEKEVKAAIDQCVDTGYEMVILSFGSGLNMEDNSPENIKKYKKLADYAHSKGIALGGYSLFSSRSINESVDVINKETGKPGGTKFGNAPCLASEWGKDYLEKLKFFLKNTGFDLLEHDGPYPGDHCASTSHKYHKGYEDSQWVQWNMSVDFYHWLRENGIYLNAPDFYFLEGSNKCGIGYREVNWSLPREQQIVLGRQNIYDGTWEKTPSMAWTFVPLTEYHGGGKAATLEPLKDHLDSYEAHMAQNYGSGVQACYRGPRLYDAKETKDLVISQIEHYKQYRDILNSDIIHLKRPDGRSWDGFMHANPDIENKGLVMLFNPTDKTIKETLEIPMYYTDIHAIAQISHEGTNTKEYTVNRDYTIPLQVEIAPNGYTWYLIK
ncbi:MULTISPECIES: glycoside hydrolase family 36 N-terminal domain-containing protein [Flavobacteriaceae]|uniref:glycoside hydrolase family 36 N-terminal domain-containing protein n=1 Tax=Flavobacteriaceae TaxID=49546 RepID=UPI00234BAC87|nr:glycoside hydrolase family 36 N-terminal domain-containing protein [Muricauda sp. SP22]MDC6361686.1 glycoside hydrolase family 36 N-terminal domain-containing protein [Muricauda sp. SP22]